MGTHNATAVNVTKENILFSLNGGSSLTDKFRNPVMTVSYNQYASSVFAL